MLDAGSKMLVDGAISEDDILKENVTSRMSPPERSTRTLKGSQISSKSKREGQ